MTYGNSKPMPIYTVKSQTLLLNTDLRHNCQLHIQIPIHTSPLQPYLFICRNFLLLSCKVFITMEKTIPHKLSFYNECGIYCSE